MAAKKILLVDDDEVVRRTVTAILEKEKFQVIQAADGWEGLEKANKEKPDLILLDIMMPHMGGIDTLHALKANESTKSIPVIMLTAKGDMEVVHQVKDLGITGYILKPFKKADFVSRVNKALKPEKEPEAKAQEKEKEKEKKT